MKAGPDLEDPRAPAQAALGSRQDLQTVMELELESWARGNALQRLGPCLVLPELTEVGKDIPQWLQAQLFLWDLVLRTETGGGALLPQP